MKKMWIPTFFFFLYISIAARSHSATTGSEDLVHTSCINASYPELCLRTLSSYEGLAKTPNDVAQAAVNVSLSRARKVSDYLNQVARSLGSSNNKRQRFAVSDCVEQLSDSVDELRKTMSELRDIRDRSGKFRWHMSNAQTWVSAALTDEDTCLDGFQDVVSGGSRGGIGKKVKLDVKRKMSNVAKVTSNALYLINRLEVAHRGGHGFLNLED